MSKFKTYSIGKTDELLCARAVVRSKRLGVKVNKVAEKGASVEEAAI